MAVDFGETILAPSRIWRAGATGLLLSEREEEWYAFDDVPRPLPNGPACLLEGNAILAASLLPGTLDWMVEGVALPVDSAQVATMTRGEGIGGTPGWNVVLADGNTFFGSLKMPYLAMQRGEHKIELPVNQLRAYRVP